MKKIIAGSLAALTAGSALAAAAPAAARPYHHYHHGGDGAGAAVAAGIAGLAIGAALAGGHRDYVYDRPYYAYPPARTYYYYGSGPAYYDGPYYRRCHTEWRWSHRWDRYTRVRVCY